MLKINMIEGRMSDFGIPILRDCKIKLDLEIDALCKFLFKKSHLLIIGDNCLQACYKVARFLLIRNLGCNINWKTQSSLDKLETTASDYTFLLQLYNESVNHRKRLAGAFITNSIANGSYVVIGANNADIIEQAFPYDLDIIEANFEVWRM